VEAGNSGKASLLAVLARRVATIQAALEATFANGYAGEQTPDIGLSCAAGEEAGAGALSPGQQQLV
jgi:hypothetical protein